MYKQDIFNEFLWNRFGTYDDTKRYIYHEIHGNLRSYNNLKKRYMEHWDKHDKFLLQALREDSDKYFYENFGFITAYMYASLITKEEYDKYCRIITLINRKQRKEAEEMYCEY